MMATYPKYFREFSCFDDLTDEQIDTIAEFSDAVCYPANKILFKEGEVGKKLYFLRKGELEVLFNIGEEGQVRVDTLFGEEIAGCSALVEPYTYSATEKTLTEVEVLEVDNQALRELIHKDCQLGLLIQHQLIKKLMKRILDFRINLLQQ
ncbi:MAG: cyclic nucleotide-binding domain-containing protein [Anaerolineaceae bacterium]|nr:cyclic nucleotide-binding domain-containing protein [Anaerolineaceae bacterium]